MRKSWRWLARPANTQKGEVAGPGIVIALAFLILVCAILPFVFTMFGMSARQSLENDGYVVFSAGEYNALIASLNAIRLKTDNLPAFPANETTAAAAVVNANAAVLAAQNAVTAAEAAAAKVDLFNCAERFLFPSATNYKCTLTAGVTNVFSNWAEITDNAAATFSSCFSSDNGYIVDMMIFDHSAVDKMYLVEISYGVAKVPLGRVMYHTSFTDSVDIKSVLVPMGETVYYRMMSSGAAGATAQVGFRYIFD